MSKQSFRKLLAMVLVIVSSLYLAAITFFNIPVDNMDNAKVIMGFALGTAISTIIGFYFGDSEE